MGDVLGTPHYMSPEQVLGEKVDSRSDLFSAGVVLYQLLTGALPFDGDSLISVAFKITKSDPPSIDKLRPDLPLGAAASDRPRAQEAAGQALPDRRGFRAGADRGRRASSTDDERKKGSGRGISLSVRWALMMAALVAVTMTLTAAVLYQRQYTAMLDQVKNYGGSLAKLVATEMAVPLLAEDWAAIDVFIQETTSPAEFPPPAGDRLPGRSCAAPTTPRW